jgi:GTPase KRas protein
MPHTLCAIKLTSRPVPSLPLIASWVRTFLIRSQLLANIAKSLSLYPIEVSALSNSALLTNTTCRQAYDPTIEDAFRKEIVIDDCMCFIEILDTAGQGLPVILTGAWQSTLTSTSPRQICNTSGPMGSVSSFPLVSAARALYLHLRLFSEGEGFILVYSIADQSSFNCLEGFRQSMIRVTRQNPVFVLVGNQNDKRLDREVSREEGAALARNLGCGFIETSAKMKDNIKLLFINLVRTLQKAHTPTTHRKERRSRRCCIL